MMLFRDHSSNNPIIHYSSLHYSICCYVQISEIDMSHPLFLKRSNLLYYVLAWLLVAVFQFLVLHFQFALSPQTALLDSFISNAVYAGMGLSFWYPCRYISLERKGLLSILLNHAITASMAALIWLGIVYLILVKIAAAGADYQQFFLLSFPWRFFIGVLLYFVMVAFYYLLIYYYNFQEKLTREAELNSLVKEAELKMLKFQINPHFIFNSLNSINSLILTDSTRASEMTVKLSEFIRATLSGNDIATKALGEELKTARLYLDIEKIRFGDKIRYNEDIEKECLETAVPGMFLQPLFENAIKHGVYESIQPVKIELACTRKNEYLEIILENDYDPETASAKGEGIGLKNIRSRLEMIYNRTNLLQFEKEGDIFRVKIYIPLEAGGKEV